MSNPKTLLNHRSGEAVDGTWRLDPARSSIEFRTAHFWGLITVTGHFEVYEGQLDMSVDPAIELTVDANSVQTGNRKRDRHLRSADFFDAVNHPRMRFVSDSVELLADTLSVRGRLSARGASIPLELQAQVGRVDGELQFEATTVAPHRELGMSWSPLRMISPRSELRIRAHLTPALEMDRAA